MTNSDREIEVLAGFGFDAGLIPLEAQVLDRDLVERLQQAALDRKPHRPHHPRTEAGFGELVLRRLAVLDLRYDSGDVADGDAAPFAGEAVAATRSTNAGENAGAHQALQHLLEVA